MELTRKNKNTRNLQRSSKTDNESNSNLKRTAITTITTNHEDNN
jgi:hypothetical protein